LWNFTAEAEALKAFFAASAAEQLSKLANVRCCLDWSFMSALIPLPGSERQINFGS
jgi:hypothetical protein